MEQHPVSASWVTGAGQEVLRSKTQGNYKLTDEQCGFINANVGVSRRTLRDVATMFNEKFCLKLSYEEFLELRSSAIAEGRCKTTYFRNYFKGENSSERELRKQRSVLISRITGCCQYQQTPESQPCGTKTSGRFCELHVRQGHKSGHDNRRGDDYIDSSLGKYG